MMNAEFVILVFFYIRSADHPDLHSFPTRRSSDLLGSDVVERADELTAVGHLGAHLRADRKSTRLNSSHLGISYAVFCLKKKNPPTTMSCLASSFVASHTHRAQTTSQRQSAEPTKS